MSDSKIWELAEAYLAGTLSEQEQSDLRTRLQVDLKFANEFNDSVNILRSLRGSSEEKQFRAKINDVHNNLPKDFKAKQKTISLSYWRTAGIAASIAIITSLATFWVAQHNNNKIASQYSLLRRDLETYKQFQKKIIGDIKKQTSSPQLRARYTGTGFAIANEGYLATSYHVVKGADSVYIQHADGNYYKTRMVTFNEATDVAVLQVESDSFQFAKYDIPYTLKSSRQLAARVFTLGFPQDEIVYNEGYISAQNGYSGDTTQFRLDIQAGPGQSGAPVVNKEGYIIGIITGKESESAGTTYAVSSDALIDLLKTLPEDNKIKVPSINRLGRYNRERQIDKLQHYTCAIKVYKK